LRVAPFNRILTGLPRLLVLLGLIVGICSAVGVHPESALALSCPAASVTWHTADDTNGYQFNANADNYSSGSDTCFSDAANGQMTLTQTYQTSSVDPTSYPNDGYGCGSSDCSSGWTSKVWSTPTMKLTGSMSNAKVEGSSKYDDLVDSLFTTSTGDFSTPSAELEIVTYAAPSYSGLGFCASASCGAKSKTIGGTSYWFYEKTATSGSKSWSDYYFVAKTMAQSVNSLPLATFYSDANSSGLGSGFGTLNLGFVGYGNELWYGSTGLQINSVLASNMP
jgi:hypothetical protein